MIANKLNLLRRVGDILVDRGIISEEQLQQAVAVQDAEPEAIRRRIGTILAEDFGVDRHRVMKEIADFYAFREVGSIQEFSNPERINATKRVVGEFSAELIDKLVNRKTIPYKYERGTLLLASADPTDPSLIPLVNQLNLKQYEIAYCRLELVEMLIANVYEKKNEFLDLLEELDFDAATTVEEAEIDEADIDAEINQSMLNSLVEGMLVEAVRQGVSDIHVIPNVGNTTDILFRIDGKLNLWYTQSGVKPEALSAVIKDKTRNVDRFERDSTQDGFIQRRVDDHNLRFRVSIMPIVGAEYDRKFESIVIRVLDDRKVITDLNKLGLQKQAHADFVKAITKPSIMSTSPSFA